MLSETEIDRFQRDGFVRVDAAVPLPVVGRCVDIIWEILTRQGIARDDPSTWSAPVIRIDCPEGDPFVGAGTARPLWEAYEQLIGPGAWWKREGIGGTIPVRFPHHSNHRTDERDTAWHIEASYSTDSGGRTNVRSRDRALLALFLFTDVGADDAPTRIRIGSHIDAARVLAAAGDEGLGASSARLTEKASAGRPVSYATGCAGDVYLCHPFLVHAASWPHRGRTPRIMAQPGVLLLEPFPLTPRSDVYPVERAIINAIS
jgi:hypothetical protein